MNISAKVVELIMEKLDTFWEDMASGKDITSSSIGLARTVESALYISLDRARENEKPAEAD